MQHIVVNKEFNSTNYFVTLQWLILNHYIVKYKGLSIVHLSVWTTWVKGICPSDWLDKLAWVGEQSSTGIKGIVVTWATTFDQLCENSCIEWLRESGVAIDSDAPDTNGILNLTGTLRQGIVKSQLTIVTSYLIRASVINPISYDRPRYSFL